MIEKHKRKPLVFTYLQTWKVHEIIYILFYEYYDKNRLPTIIIIDAIQHRYQSYFVYYTYTSL